MTIRIYAITFGSNEADSLLQVHALSPENVKTHQMKE